MSNLHFNRRKTIKQLSWNIQGQKNHTFKLHQRELEVVSDVDIGHFGENLLQPHLILVLSGQKFSSGLFQYESIVLRLQIPLEFC